MAQLRRLSAIVLCLSLLAGNAAVCAGWALTPEARMACCAEDEACPMHQSGVHGAGTHLVITQLEADNCCAASERQSPTQSGPTFVAAITAAVLGAGIVLPATAPTLMVTDGWRTAAPIPLAPVPRHVLLSVFLV